MRKWDLLFLKLATHDILRNASWRILKCRTLCVCLHCSIKVSQAIWKVIFLQSRLRDNFRVLKKTRNRNGYMLTWNFVTTRACIWGEKISKSELDTTFWIFPHFFQKWQSSNSGPAGRMAGLQVLKNCGKIQNVVSSSDWDIFSPKMYVLGPRCFATRGQKD